MFRGRLRQITIMSVGLVSGETVKRTGRMALGEGGQHRLGFNDASSAAIQPTAQMSTGELYVKSPSDTSGDLYQRVLT